MNRHKLKLYEDKKAKLEFPLKCHEYDIKLSFDKKKLECKNKYKSISNQIIKEYLKNKKTINYLDNYIDKITIKSFGDILYSKEKNILENLETNFKMIKDYGKMKDQLYMNDREDIENKAINLFKNEENKENKKFEYIKDETKYAFNIYNKFKEDFLETKKRYINPINNYEKLIYENRHLITKLELIKNLNKNLKKMLKKEKQEKEKLLQMENKNKEKMQK